MKRTKDEIIAGLRRQNEYVLRHNKELREKDELAQKAINQVNDLLRAITLSLARKCGDTQEDGSIILRIPRPDVSDANEYEQLNTYSENGDMLCTFAPIEKGNQNTEKSDG